MPLIQRIHHIDIIIPRGAGDAARAFYCGALGFREIPKPASLGKNGGLGLEIGDQQVHLSIQDGYDPRKTKGHIAYLVPDLEEIKRVVAQQGLRWSDNVEIPGYVRGDLRDPFGNRIEFIQAV